MAVTFGAYVAVRNGIKLGILTGGITWLMSWPVFGVAIRQRWGPRHDTGDVPAPTLRRPLSEASDGWLSIFMWFFALGTVGLAIGLVAGTDGSPFGGFVSLGLSILILLIIWTERRRRRNRR